MKPRHHLLATLLILLSSLGASLAQTRTEVANDSATTIVTATATSERVRYIAVGEVHQTRLQVFSAQGALVYDSGLRLGNLINWKLENQQGTRLADGTYLFLLTVHDFSNGLTQKYGTATLEQGRVYLEQGGRDELSPTQATALEANTQAETLSSIDRVGAEGSNRLATVASEESTPSVSTTTPPESAPPGENIGGTGTQNKVAKWIDNAGTLGDSIIFDSGSGVGVGTTDLSDVLIAGNDKFKIVDGAMTFSFRDFSNGQGYFAVGSTANGIEGYIGHTNTTDGFTLGTFTNHKLTIRTNSVNQLTIDTFGNVGIGTTTPTRGKLDVVGSINTSTQYNILGERVLSVLGIGNTFGGVSAGRSNSTGTDNTFFGDAAGRDNTSGNFNSFFGMEAGDSNRDGDGNAFFGRLAGRDNTEGGLNAFFGAQAGLNNTTGSFNTFLGYNVGLTHRTGSYNTLIGSNADVGAIDLEYATAIGADAVVNLDDRIVIGKIAGTYNGVVRPADTVRIPGELIVVGNVTKGGGSFKIDHPLDPLNKTLSHSFVESPDMMNVYNGNVTTDRRGIAVVTLPDYFEALNRDFRYQLTVIGKFAQAIVLKKIEGNRFLIKTNRPRVEVSWQVTGIRRDAYAEANRIPTVEFKPETERGTLLHPQAFNRETEAANARNRAGTRAKEARLSP